MKYVKYRAEAQGGDDNVFWVTMSDLLLGLVVVFLVLFVFAITGFTQNKVNEQEKQYEVTEKIAKELEKNNIKVDVDKFSGRIKISDLELFALNSAELSPKGRAYMSKFVPVYLNTVMKDPEVRKNITRIIIEGHTDSQAFAKVSEVVPEDIELTSFSILFARLKGNLQEFYNGAKKIDSLQDGNKVLICESCSHHQIEDDIARVKIPNWLRKKTGRQIEFVYHSGHDFPENLHEA